MIQSHCQTPNLPTLFPSFQLWLKIPFRISQVGLRSCNKYERDGHWNEKQRLKYVIFLSFFQSILLDPSKKKLFRIYQMMSDMIITRNSNQCRSHHQKMLNYRKQIPEIINSVAQKYEPTLFEALKLKYMVFIKNILLNQPKYRRVSQEGEKTKYIETCIDFNIKAPNVQIKLQHLDQGEIVKPVQLQQQKDKEDLKKTSDQYLPNSQYVYQEQHIDQIPIIEMPDLKLQELQKCPIPNQQSNNEGALNNQQMGVHGLFSVQEGGLVLTAQGRSYYESQIQLLSTKRQWHTNNMEQLNAQLASEKESINYCETTIKLYSLALNNKKREI